MAPVHAPNPFGLTPKVKNGDDGMFGIAKIPHPLKNTASM